MTEDERGGIIQRLKGLPEGRDGVRLPIRNESLQTIGYLRAFDMALLDDAELIRTMAETHTHYKNFFLTQFDVTPENKRMWLEQSVLKNDRKILFLVETNEHIIVGQDGFTLLDKGVFLLDGTMRWLKQGHKELYVRCGIERAAICFFLLECELSTTEVFKDNIANVKNSLRMGHEITKEYKLFLSERDGVFKYEKIGEADTSNTDRTLVSFHMNKESFIRQHHTIVANPSWENLHIF